MVGITIDLQTKEVKNFLKVLGDKAVGRATSKAINRTIVTVRKESTGLIHKETKIIKGIISKSHKITFKANAKKLLGRFRARAHGLNLIEFVTPSQKNTTFFRKKKRKGVEAKAWGKPNVYEGTFIGRGQKSGKLLVFKSPRKGVAEGVWGPSIPSTFLKDKHVRRLNRVGDKAFIKNFNSFMQFEISKIKGK